MPSPGRRRRVRRRAAWRTVTGTALTAVVLAGAVLVGLAGADARRDAAPGRLRATQLPGASTAPPSAASTGSSANPSAESSTAASAGRLSWSGALAELDRTRAAAYRRADVTVLRAVYATGSPAGRRDSGALRRLSSAGLRTAGLQVDRLSVSAVAQGTGDSVVLAVADRLRPYRLVDRRGRVVDRRQGRGRTEWRIELRREADRWLVYDVQLLPSRPRAVRSAGSKDG